MSVCAPPTCTEWQQWSTSMAIAVTDPDRLARARAEVDAELQAVERAASRFRQDSEISALASSAGRPTEVSDVLAVLLEAALAAARLTDGDVDPTIGAALIALGYDRDLADLDYADPRAASMTIPATWSMVEWDGRFVTVPPGVLLDLGATAKAVAADRCAARVHSATGCGVLVSLGGDIATAGPAPLDGWQVLVHDHDDDPAQQVGLPAGGALATSSTVHRRWGRGDAVVHHILDPRTRRPATAVWRTVSVAADSCFAANTISTAAIVRGWRALEWIATLRVPARLIDSDRRVHTIGAWPEAQPGDPR
ncbi:membrane-associated lipoprotein involved in thiamine biosynthesis [Mycolicibacterium chubuense NBB4]|uniref:FAD:protein FMN transferase n=1 Tax=Mycolicibacterium chubuense (strain NBB4) TaxID=710421 RepID=I4BD23_MYCCN|nr:FAD:protein FMN transferase [Mycolicibacterium chubuense]AFM15180.1 membrane-associated lipoprotein involved in thiamine biosynthesis [Mycolicibacterium chubuense NBB4]